MTSGSSTTLSLTCSYKFRVGCLLCTVHQNFGLCEDMCIFILSFFPHRDPPTLHSSIYACHTMYSCSVMPLQLIPQSFSPYKPILTKPRLQQEVQTRRERIYCTFKSQFYSPPEFPKHNPQTSLATPEYPSI